MALSLRTRLSLIPILAVAAVLAGLLVTAPALLRPALPAAVVAALVALVPAVWIAAVQVRRTRALESAVTRVADGEAPVAEELPGDELGRLGRAINRMALALRGRLAALAGERDERERMLAHMSDGVALVDAQDRIVHANHSLAGLVGAALPPAVGTAFREFARSPELADLLRVAREREQPVESDVRLWTPEQRRVRVTATRLAGSESGAVLLVLHDLTEAELLNQVRQDFVANVSHELKTPLTSVRGYAETLLDGGLDDLAHREEFVRIIRDQASRLESMVDDLLSLAELERPDARLRLSSFDLRDAALRQIAMMRGRADRAGLALELESGAPAPLEADRMRVEQVFANLLDNATKYTEAGEVRVRIGAGNGHVWCEVRDTGPGIPADDLPRVFERFYRVDKARSRDKGGTGLGLAIVKHIVSLHGGRVAAESTPGEGSAFRFDLPTRPIGARADA